MRFIYLELENYIGIYNGMRLNSIKIDLSRSMYRTLIIRGENGSGKSTIFKALSVFPDSNDSFIPGAPAKKIIALLDHDVAYTIKFIHGIKANGDRDTTKAFISKNINGIDVELNENGNVTSFKDIVYSELSLDPNFAALSQLSSDDKGLATKRPAERKKFVNNIIESLEVYNGIYKSISKKSNNLKSLIDNLVTKLGAIGDMVGLRAKLDELNVLISQATSNKQDREQIIMDNMSSVKALDPDGKIQHEYNNTRLEMAKEEESFKNSMKQYGRTVFNPETELSTIRSQVESYRSTIESTKMSRTLLDESSKNVGEYLAEISAQLNEKKLKLQSISISVNIDGMLESYDQYSHDLDGYMSEISASGIDPNLFTKDEYIIALETVKDIKSIVDLFRSDFDYETIDEAVMIFSKHGWPSVAPLYDLTLYNNKLDEAESIRNRFIQDINSAAMDMEAITKLADRPVSCKDDTCPFIADLVRINNTDPKKRYAELEVSLKEIESDIDKLKAEFAHKTKVNEALNQIKVILRAIDNNGRILRRLPNGGIFESKEEFFTKLLSGDDFSYMAKLYEYIDLANMVELYHKTKEILKELKNKIDLHQSKSAVIKDLENEIATLEDRVNTTTLSYSEMRKSIANLDTEVIHYSNLHSVSVSARDILERAVDSMYKIISYRETLAKMEDNMNKIRQHTQAITKAKNEIAYFDSLLSQYNESKDSVVFSIKQAEEYEQELAAIKEQYNRIEIIKHYSSPTKGIQLVFMELYMGKILTLANELLSFLFNGEYQIQPFIINEDEFRIPCLGQGCLNDDISSMSSSQLTMISMIISFALLSTSSTKYNILKLDEIDGPLDENNRIMFINVINRIMDLMNVEQCIIVSHSAELQVDTSDVILLKSEQLSTDYNRGNIIWKY